MKNKLKAIVIIALILEVLLIFIISILALLGAMNMTDGCMYRYPLVSSTTLQDATTSSITVKANGNYTSATTQSQNTTVQTPGPGPQIFSNGTTGYTYGQWLKTNINVVNGQAIQIGVAGSVSLCRAYLPSYNLESNSNIAVHSLATNPKVIAGRPIPLPRLEESTPPIRLLFDASQSEGWRNLTNIMTQDKVQVTIGVNPVQITQNTVVMNNLSSIPFQSIFAGDSQGQMSANCSDGLRAYSPICNRYTPYSIPASPQTNPPSNHRYITGCNVSILATTPTKCCGAFIGIFGSGDCCQGDGCCVHSTGKICDDGVYSCSWVQGSTTPLWTSVLAQIPQPYNSNRNYTWQSFSTNGQINLFGYDGSGFLYDNNPSSITDSSGVAHQNSTVCAAQNPGVNPTANFPDSTPGTTWPSSSYTNQQFFWLASDAAIGLYERTSNNAITSSNVSSNVGLGATKAPVQLIKGQYVANLIKDFSDDSGAPQNQSGYLQYRFMTIGDNPPGSGTSTFQYNSGGYIIELKQTACRARNGLAITPPATNNASVGTDTNPRDLSSNGSIGDIRYLIIDSNIDPNNPADLANSSYATQLANVQALPGGDAPTTITPSTTSTNPQALWLKIANTPANYSDSFGEYAVKFYSTTNVDQFSDKVMNKILENFKNKIVSAGIKIFENMTCMSCQSNNPNAVCTPVGDKSNCYNFLTYIKAILTLYIMVFGMMFLLGLVKISNQDFVIRIVKIAIIAGLLSGDTVRFFNNYLFNVITQFSDEMIANLAGYAANTLNMGNVINPFGFMDELMSRIFFSKTFFTQVLALLSLGISGAFYFIIVFIALVVLIITTFRAISIYIMAFTAIALLLGLGPLFLTFMLFEKTFYLFENWVRFLFRYMMEPVILMVGITILSQLFTVYLDYVINYSVCWKCGLVFKIPFSFIPGLSSFQDLPLFCINWFTPWGLDNSGASGMMGINLQNMIALVMIAYAMYGYTEISGTMVGRLTSTMLAPSMTAAGNAMSSAIGQKALKQIGMDEESRNERSQNTQHDAGVRRKEVKKLLDEQKKEPKAGAVNKNDNNNQQDSKKNSPSNGGSSDSDSTKRGSANAANKPTENEAKKASAGTEASSNKLNNSSKSDESDKGAAKFKTRNDLKKGSGNEN